MPGGVVGIGLFGRGGDPDFDPAEHAPSDDPPAAPTAVGRGDVDSPMEVDQEEARGLADELATVREDLRLARVHAASQEEHLRERLYQAEQVATRARDELAARDAQTSSPPASPPASASPSTTSAGAPSPSTTTSAGSTTTPSPAPRTAPPSPALSSSSTGDRLQAIVDRDLQRLETGEISELSAQSLKFMDMLFTPKASKTPVQSNGSSSHSGGGSAATCCPAAEPPPECEDEPLDWTGVFEALGVNSMSMNFRDCADSNRGSNRGGNSDDQRSSRPRPRCTYANCRKPLGHTEDICFQKQRDQKKADA